MSYTLVLEWMPGDLYMSAVTARCTAPTSSYSVVWLPPNKVYQITLYCGSTSLVSFLVGAFRGKAWSYMYKKNNGSTEQEILQNQFSAYVKKAVHNRRIQFLTEKSRKFRFETPLFDLDYLLFDTTDIIQEITDHETVRQALRSIKENERRIVLERIIEEKSFGQLSDELGMSYKTVASLYYRAIKKLRRFMEEGESK